MTRGLTANITPQLLKWARETSGYSLEDAALKLKYEADVLHDWETGEAKPTISKLRKIAQTYKRPLALFFLQKPPKAIKTPTDFRTLPKDIPSELSPKARLAIRKIYWKHDMAVELAQELEDEFPNSVGRTDLNQDAEKVALKVREQLGISSEQQFSWRDPYTALRRWKYAIEDQGILVFQFSDVPTNEMRGFSRWEKQFPIIAVNSKDSVNGKIFSFFHEYAHLMLRNTAMCDFREGQKKSLHEMTEVFCNQFSGSLLAPKNILLADEKIISNKSKEWSSDLLISLSRQYCISQDALLRRLLTLGLTTKKFYETKHKESLDNFNKPNGPVKQHIRAVSDNGFKYTSLVLDSYKDEIITAGDVSSYLGYKAKHIDNIDEYLGKRLHDLVDQK